MQPARILIGLVILVLIAGAGFYAGKALNEQPVTAKTAQVAPEPFKPNRKTYKVSPPSIGVLSSVVEIDLPPNNYLPYLVIPAERAAAFQVGQKVVVKDADGKTLDLAGEIISITDAPPVDGKPQTAITIGIRALSAMALRTVAKGVVEIGKDSSVSRLPLEAVIVGEDGQPRIWEVSKNKDGTANAYLKGLTVLAQTSSFVAIEPPANSSNLFILNPDKNLQDGAPVSIAEELYAGPEFTEGDAIAMAMAPRLVQQARAEKIARMPVSSGAYTSPSCTVPVATNFINEIRGARPGLPMSVPKR